MEYISLNNGVKMPILGYGVYQVTKEECERCVLDALKVGYRAIDTAQSYFNEEEVGNAIQKSGIPREEIFLTTKVWVEHYGYEEAKKSVLESMKKLKTDYLDLVLLHQPFSDAYGAYHALEDLYDEGKIRAIGISNFYVDRMVDFASFNRIKPMVNQVETHIFNQQKEMKEWADKYDIRLEAWAPFGEGRGGTFENPVIAEIAEKYQKTPAQVISTNLDAEKLGLNELLVYVDGILANLCMGSEYEKFEEALSQIGTILGFVCSRPDKETGGYGPDNLWAIDTGKYLVIECKTEATTQTIKKDYCNQLSGSVNWFKENYIYPNECVPIMIHPSKVVDEVASPDENMRVMTEKELTCFRKNLRDFYSTLCQNGNLSDVNKINELLRIYKLRKDDIVNRYTVKFERKD